MHGTTNAASVVVAVGPTKKPGAVSGGRFSTEVELSGIDNTISAAAIGRDGSTAYERRTVLSYGERVGGLTDPTRRRQRAGHVRLPDQRRIQPGQLRPHQVRQVPRRRPGPARHPRGRRDQQPVGGDGMNMQRVNVLLRDPTQTATTAAGLPGTATTTAGTWQRAVVADGRYAETPLSLDVYDPALTKVSAAEMRGVPATQVSIYFNAEPGEGTGLVRTVYSKAHWDNGFPWTKEFRFGGGAGEQSFDLPSRDTDTRDPNTIDVITGDANQAAVLDWTTTSPVVLHFVETAARESRALKATGAGTRP
ncbi:hypothetical protein [Amycolatopsis thermoflava]